MTLRTAVRLWRVGLRCLARLTLALVVLAAIGLGALSWRLARGPLELPWLAHRLEELANNSDGPARLSIGRAELAWGGLTSGQDRRWTPG